MFEELRFKNGMERTSAYRARACTEFSHNCLKWRVEPSRVLFAALHVRARVCVCGGRGFKALLKTEPIKLLLCTDVCVCVCVCVHFVCHCVMCAVFVYVCVLYVSVRLCMCVSASNVCACTCVCMCVTRVKTVLFSAVPFCVKPVDVHQRDKALPTVQNLENGWKQTCGKGRGGSVGGMRKKTPEKQRKQMILSKLIGYVREIKARDATQGQALAL